MKNHKGEKSSPLDDITPTSWPPEFTSELLQLLEKILEGYPRKGPYCANGQPLIILNPT